MDRRAKSSLPSLALSKSFGLPHRSSMMRRRSAALRSCSFFNSSAAFLRSNNYNLPKPIFKLPFCPLSDFQVCYRTHAKFLLPLWSHETLLGLLGFGGLLHALAHFRALALNFGLFGLLCLLNITNIIIKIPYDFATFIYDENMLLKHS